MSRIKFYNSVSIYLVIIIIINLRTFSPNRELMLKFLMELYTINFSKISLLNFKCIFLTIRAMSRIKFDNSVSNIKRIMILVKLWTFSAPRGHYSITIKYIDIKLQILVHYPKGMYSNKSGNPVRCFLELLPLFQLIVWF